MRLEWSLIQIIQMNLIKLPIPIKMHEQQAETFTGFVYKTWQTSCEWKNCPNLAWGSSWIMTSITASDYLSLFYCFVHSEIIWSSSSVLYAMTRSADSFLWEFMGRLGTMHSINNVSIWQPFCSMSLMPENASAPWYCKTHGHWALKHYNIWFCRNSSIVCL